MAAKSSDINLKNFITVALKTKNRDKFHSLDCSSLAAFLKDDDLLVENEKEAFDALRNWVMHKPKDRFADVPKLLPLIRLNHLETNFLKTKVKDFAVQGESAQLIKWAIKRQNRPLGHRDELTVDFCTKPRKSAAEIEIFALYSKKIRTRRTYETTVKKYSVKDSVWTEVSPGHIIGKFNLQLGYCMRGNRLIVYDKESFRFYSMNLSNMTVEQLAHDPVKAEEFTLTSVGDSYYLVGHYMQGVGPGEPYVLSSLSDFERLRSVAKRFNFATQKWTITAPMNTVRIGHCSAGMNGKLYVAGGFPNGTVECYDPDMDEWSILAPMCHERCNAEMVAHNGYLYVFGGRGYAFGSFDAFKEVERYDPIENEWTVVAKMDVKMFGFSVVTILDRVYLIGGKDVGRNPIIGMNKKQEIHDAQSSKPSAVFDLNTESFMADLIPAMPNNFSWPIVGYYIKEN